jgi:hypothetical protein
MKDTSTLSAYISEQVPKRAILEDDAERHRVCHLLQIARWMVVLAKPRKLNLT